jgi:hypothetical protein
MLLDLAARMKTRILTRVEPRLDECFSGGASESAFLGTTVIAARTAAAAARRLLREGAEEILILPEKAVSPHRVLIHWTADSARRPTLAVSASLLRHLAAEAMYVGVLTEEGPSGAGPRGLRALLDARLEARATHGLEMRTELRYGVAAQQLAEHLAEAPHQMLILGLSDPDQLAGEFGQLLQAPAQPVLIVHRRSAGASLGRSAA